jgi:hypothetical protein
MGPLVGIMLEPQLYPQRRTRGAGGGAVASGSSLIGGDGDIRVFVGVESALKRRVLAMNRVESW